MLTHHLKDHETISGPKHPFALNQNFFSKTKNILSMQLLVPFTLPNPNAPKNS